MLSLLSAVDALKTCLELDIEYVIKNPRQVIAKVLPLVKLLQAEAKGLSATDQHYIADLVAIISKLSKLVDAISPPFPTPTPKPVAPPTPAPVLPTAPVAPAVPAPAPVVTPPVAAVKQVAPVVVPTPAPVAPVAPVAAPVATPAAAPVAPLAAPAK